MLLSIRQLSVFVEEIPILKDFSLDLPSGQVVALMGPNGSGKSTLASVLMGNENYSVQKGSIQFKGEDLLVLPSYERARRGLFLAFQYPLEIPGLSVGKFLKRIKEISCQVQGKDFVFKTFYAQLQEDMELLKMPKDFLNRYLNEGFSGGEKKRMEILQMITLEPSLAILDETDSGLDIDALRDVCQAFHVLQSRQQAFSALIITHYQRILDYIQVNRIHIMKQGRIVHSGDANLAKELEKKGYQGILSSE